MSETHLTIVHVLDGGGVAGERAGVQIPEAGLADAGSIMKTGRKSLLRMGLRMGLLRARQSTILREMIPSIHP